MVNFNFFKDFLHFAKNIASDLRIANKKIRTAANVCSRYFRYYVDIHCVSIHNA